MHIKFIKCHGSGNDFVMIDERDLLPNILTSDIPRFIQSVCDRSGPIGADGVLVVANSEQYDGKMIMYNSDGTEAEMCGNGMRCVARKLLTVRERAEIHVESKIGSVFCRKMPDMHSGVYTVSVVIGPINLNADSVPIQHNGTQVINEIIPEIDPNAQFTALSIPNPHLIAIVPEIDFDKLTNWGEAILNNPQIFPNGINVSMVQKKGDNHIFVATYERGCSITAACGTAYSSSCYVSCMNGVCDYDTSILAQSKGGVSYCRISQNRPEEVLLVGNATYVYEAVVDWDTARKQIIAVNHEHKYEYEVSVYKELLMTVDSGH